jgi:hypothetical protein
LADEEAAAQVLVLAQHQVLVEESVVASAHQVFALVSVVALHQELAKE